MLIGAGADVDLEATAEGSGRASGALIWGMGVGFALAERALGLVGTLRGSWSEVGEAGNGTPVAIGCRAKWGVDALQESGDTLCVSLPIEVL